MHQICIKYASNMHQICHYIDFNIANRQIICKKYAINMQLICRICISLCICIFCIYMHSPLCWCHYWKIPVCARGRGSPVADFARDLGSRGAGRRPPATLPTVVRDGTAVGLTRSLRRRLSAGQWSSWWCSEFQPDSEGKDVWSNNFRIWHSYVTLRLMGPEDIGLCRELENH